MQNISEVTPQIGGKLNWSTIIGVAIFHVVAVAALFTFSWQNLLATAILWWIAGSFGIGMGYHRLLTHRGFKAPKWLEYFLSVCGSLALQSGPLTWVTTHRIHHAFTETERDPHSPRNGTYWAHMGWIFRGTAQNNPWPIKVRYCPDITKDKFQVWLDTYNYVPIIIVGAILFAIGGWTMVVWAVFFRVVLGWHSTWLVNSATHLWGSRRFQTRDDSRNNGLIAAVTFGEGWHNNHHAYPRSAKHGLAWYEIDFNWMQIWALEKIGIIKNVYAYTVKGETSEAQAEMPELTPIRETA